MVNHDLLGVSASSIQIFVFNCCKYHICIYAGLDLLADNYELIGHDGIYHPWVDAKGARLLFGCVIKEGMAQDFSHASFFPNSLSNVNTDAFSVRLYPKIPLDF